MGVYGECVRWEYMVCQSGIWCVRRVYMVCAAVVYGVWANRGIRPSRRSFSDTRPLTCAILTTHGTNYRASLKLGASATRLPFVIRGALSSVHVWSLYMSSLRCYLLSHSIGCFL